MYICEDRFEREEMATVASSSLILTVIRPK